MSDPHQDSGYPWAWIMYRALEAGMDVDSFWRSSPRAILTLHRTAMAAKGMASSGSRAPAPRDRQVDRVKLSAIPR